MKSLAMSVITFIVAVGGFFGAVVLAQTMDGNATVLLSSLVGVTILCIILGSIATLLDRAEKNAEQMARIYKKVFENEIEQAKQDGLWLCDCGAYSKESEKNCTKCGKSADVQNS